MKTKMINRIEKQKLNILYILFAVILIIMHCFIITGTNDDIWFAEILDRFKLPEYLVMRYQNWSSRMAMETAVIYFTRLNPWIWKITDVGIILLLVYECNVIWGKKDNALYTFLFMMLVFLFPASMLNSAGWISTSINYLWPITAGIFTLVPLHKWAMNEKIFCYEYYLGIVMCLFGCFQEQVVAVMFVTYILYAVYYKYQKQKIPLYWWWLFLVSAGLLIFIFTCPGNANRSIQEVGRWFPEFSGITIGNRLWIGYLNTFSYYVSCGEYNTIFLMFTFLLAVNVFYATNKVTLRCLGAYPFFVTFVWGFCGRIIIRSGITSRIYWLGLIQNEKIGESTVYGTGHIIIESLVFFSILCVTVFSLYIIYGKTIDFLMATIIIFAALCSRIIVGLSPVIYASGSRTATLGHICFLIIIFILIQKCLSAMSLKKFAVCYIPVYIFSLLQVCFRM